MVSRLTGMIDINVLGIMEIFGNETLQPRQSHKETWKCGVGEKRKNNEVITTHGSLKS